MKNTKYVKLLRLQNDEILTISYVLFYFWILKYILSLEHIL